MSVHWLVTTGIISTAQVLSPPHQPGMPFLTYLHAQSGKRIKAQLKFLPLDRRWIERGDRASMARVAKVFAAAPDREDVEMSIGVQIWL